MKHPKPRRSQSDGTVVFGTETDSALAWLAAETRAGMTVAQANAEGWATCKQIGDARGVGERAGWSYARAKAKAGDFERADAIAEGGICVQVYRPKRR